MAGEHAREFVAEGGGEEPNAHHEAEEALGGELRHRREADGAEEHFADGLEEEKTDQPQGADLTVGGEFRGGDHQHKREAHEEEPEHELQRARRLFVAEDDPEVGEDGGEENNPDRVHRLPPRGREGLAEGDVVREFVGEEGNGGAGLFEDGPEDFGGEEEDQNGGHAFAVFVGAEGEEEDGGDLDREEDVNDDGVGVGGLHRGDECEGAEGDETEFAPRAAAVGLGSGGGADVGEAFALEDVNDEAEGHADAGGAEAPVPAGGGVKAPSGELGAPALALREVAGDERGEEGADVNAHVKNREAGVAAFVGGAVEAADHRGDVGLEETGADGDEDEAGVERRDVAEGHREVAGGDDNTADENGAAGADEIIGDEAAEDREQINAHRVGAVNGGGFFGIEGEATFGGGLHHEEHEQGAHAVVGKALPHFGEEEGGEAAGVAAESAGFVGGKGGMVGRSGGYRDGVGTHNGAGSWGGREGGQSELCRAARGDGD